MTNKRLMVICAISVLLGCLSGQGCKTETIVITPPSPTNLLDTTSAPTVLTTFPMDGSIGPFSTPRDPFYNAQIFDFTIHFSKIMLYPTLLGSSISVACPGWKGIVYPLTPYNIGNEYYFAVYDSGYTHHRWRVSRAYTVTLSTTVADFNRHHLARPYSFTFTPEPYLRVVHSYPADGDTLDTRYSIILDLNGVVDSTMLPFISITPDSRYPLRGGFIKSTIIFAAGKTIRPGQWYTLTIKKGAPSTDGCRLRANWSIHFYAGAPSRISTPEDPASIKQ